MPGVEQPHNEEPQMRGKAWTGLQATAAVRPCRPGTVCCCLPPRYFWQRHCVRPYKAVAAVDGTGRCALGSPAGYAPVLLDHLKTPGRMEVPSIKLQRAACFLLLLLLCSLATARHSLPECCRQKTCSCRVYDLLHGMGNHAAGILTLGKRKSIPPAFQSRLYRLLHGSGNHAAGILTMGKRGKYPGTACHDTSCCPVGMDAQPMPALRAADASPATPRECQGHSAKDLPKSPAQGDAKSFY